MVDPRRDSEPRDYFSRREQGRLLLLVMSLGFVLIAMNEARKPENWQWLFPESRVEQPDVPPKQKDAVEWNEMGNPDEQSAGPSPHRQPSSKETEARPLPGDDKVAGKYFPGVKPEFLGTIRDKARFRGEEQDAWFHLFAVLRAADPAELRRASIGRIARIQLSEQSEAYRGELVTIRGTIRRAHRLKAPKNDYGIAGYYQTWVQPDDSPDWPIVVYCLELSDGFSTGMDISERAIITGFYFKQWLHKTKEGLQLSPVILARAVEREKSKRSKPWFLSRPSLGFWGGILIVGGAALVAAAIVSYVYRRTRRTMRLRPAVTATGQDRPGLR